MWKLIRGRRSFLTIFGVVILFAVIPFTQWQLHKKKSAWQLITLITVMMLTMMMKKKTLVYTCQCRWNRSMSHHGSIAKFQQLDWSELIKWKWYGWNSWKKNESQNTIRFWTLFLSLSSLFANVLTHFFLLQNVSLVYPKLQCTLHTDVSSLFSLIWMSSFSFHP